MERIKILVPTDFSEVAVFAQKMVFRLAERISADIHFLHILDVPDTVTMTAGGMIETCGEIDIRYVEKLKKAAEAKLEDIKSQSGQSVTTTLLPGKITDVIIQFAEKHQFDLIVMGTKGSWGIKEKLSGTETQIIARKSAIPLLSVRSDSPDWDLKQMVLVHDFNHPAPENLEVLHILIRACKPQVHLLQIAFSTEESEKLAIEANMKQFAILNHIDQFVPHILNDHNIENGVMHFNQMMHMDLICIGTHGKGGLFHQSATERLINHVALPIFSFHLQK